MLLHGWGVLFLLGSSPSFAKTISVDLVSPANCQHRFEKLIRCHFTFIDVPGHLLRSTSVPLKTRVRTLSSGDCTTPYPLQVSFTSSRFPDSVFAVPAIGRGIETVIRLPDRGKVGSLALRDLSSWTSVAIFHESCRTWLEVSTDIPDISGPDEARGIAARLSISLAETISARDAFSELISYRAAFRLLYSIADLLQQRLNLHSLRVRAGWGETRDWISLLKSMAASQTNSLSDSERSALYKISELLEELAVSGTDHPAPETDIPLAELLSQREREDLLSLASRRDQIERDSRMQEELTQRALEICVDIIQARLLLEPWLSPDEWPDPGRIENECRGSKGLPK